MKLWLLRHGEAEPRARTDAERNLTEGGRRDVRRSATFLRGKPLQTILVSPFHRAQQTADEVRKALSFGGQCETVDWLTPEADLGEALRQLDLRAVDHVHQRLAHPQSKTVVSLPLPATATNGWVRVALQASGPL